MCFGSGAPKYTPPKFGALPSLKVDKTKREEQVLKDVPKPVRRGMQQRTLLMQKGEY